MKKTIIFLFAGLCLIHACSNKSEKSEDARIKVYSVNNLKDQLFTVDVSRDTVLKGLSGTTYTIGKGIFVDSAGNAVSGKVEVQLKEAIRFEDIVLANLTTTTGGKPLQSAGMIFIDAKANGKSLNIAATGHIGVSVPADSILPDMQIFQGVKTDNGIDWVNPQPIRPLVPAIQKIMDVDAIDIASNKKAKRLLYTVDTILWHSQVPDSIINKVSNIVWGAKPLQITKDSSIKFEQYQAKLSKGDIFAEDKMVFRPHQTTPIKGNNQFLQDENTSYIFSIKKLGWANIDRLFFDPRTKDVELITAIKNHSDFKTIYITMVTEKMFLPGYQMKDNTFGFTHGDYEKPKLPIGAQAVIMATAYKNDQPYFAIKKIVIQDKQTVNLELLVTTNDKLKQELEQQL